MKFQGLKNTVSEIKNCLDELINKLNSVIVGEIEIIQTKFLREKGLEKNKQSLNYLLNNINWYNMLN